MAKATVKLVLDHRFPKKDGTLPISLLLNFKNTRSYIKIHKDIEANFWSQEFERVLKGAEVHPSVAWLNDHIADKVKDARRAIAALEDQGLLEAMSHTELRLRISNRQTGPLSFTEYTEGIAREFEKAGRMGQATLYGSIKGFLERYGPKKGVYQFDDVNYRLLRLIETRFKPRKEGNLNGLSIYFRTIRAVWNRAIKEGVVKAEKYPFKQYRIKSSKTHKTAITQEAMALIAALPLEAQSTPWHCRNLFFFSFFCRGMNFADIAKLKVSNIHADRLVYVRAKVGTEFTIKINDQIAEILSSYLNGKKEDDYIFPIIRRDSSLDERKQTRNYHKLVHKRLKSWAKSLSLDPTLSFNTARHSWATIGRDLNLSVSMISQGLGHKDIQTTQIYLDEFSQDAIDNAANIVSSTISLV